MFSWIRHYMSEVCASPSALLVYTEIAANGRSKWKRGGEANITTTEHRGTDGQGGENWARYEQTGNIIRMYRHDKGTEGIGRQRTYEQMGKADK